MHTKPDIDYKTAHTDPSVLDDAIMIYPDL